MTGEVVSDEALIKSSFEKFKNESLKEIESIKLRTKGDKLKALLKK